MPKHRVGITHKVYRELRVVVESATPQEADAMVLAAIQAGNLRGISTHWTVKTLEEEHGIQVGTKRVRECSECGSTVKVASSFGGDMCKACRDKARKSGAIVD